MVKISRKAYQNFHGKLENLFPNTKSSPDRYAPTGANYPSIHPLSERLSSSIVTPYDSHRIDIQEILCRSGTLPLDVLLSNNWGSLQQTPNLMFIVDPFSNGAVNRILQRTEVLKLYAEDGEWGTILHILTFKKAPVLHKMKFVSDDIREFPNYPLFEDHSNASLESWICCHRKAPQSKARAR